MAGGGGSVPGEPGPRHPAALPVPAGVRGAGARAAGEAARGRQVRGNTFRL